MTESTGPTSVGEGAGALPGATPHPYDPLEDYAVRAMMWLLPRVEWQGEVKGMWYASGGGEPTEDGMADRVLMPMAEQLDTFPRGVLVALAEAPERVRHEGLLSEISSSAEHWFRSVRMDTELDRVFGPPAFARLDASLAFSAELDILADYDSSKPWFSSHFYAAASEEGPVRSSLAADESTRELAGGVVLCDLPPDVLQHGRAVVLAGILSGLLSSGPPTEEVVSFVGSKLQQSELLARVAVERGTLDPGVLRPVLEHEVARLSEGVL